ncbi:MAG: hypothetical protein ACXWLH_05215 [Candidatus Saccharimonadales bacterium]
MQKKYSSKQKNSSSRARFWWYFGGVLILVAIILLITELTNTTHIFHKQPAVAETGNSNTKGVPESSSSQSTSNDGTSGQDQTGQPGDTKHQGTTSVALIAPWGEFANTYQANANTQMVSTCNTTPGATCQILFTKGGVTKSLDTQTTDRGGAVRWSWKPSQPGLTTGTWHIIAKAVFGSQSKTTSNDPLTLEIN